MFAVLIAFVCPMFHAISNIIDAHLSNKVFNRLQTLIFYNSLTSFFATFMVLVFGMPQWVGWAMLPLLAVIGMIEVFYQIPYYAALRRSDTSVVTAWFSLGYVLVPVLAYFMVGEKLHFIQYLGFGLLIFSSIALNIDNPRKIRLNKAFFLMLFSSSLLAVEAVLYKYVLQEIDWISAVFYTAIFSTMTSFLFLFGRQSRLDIILSFAQYKSQFKLFGFNEIISQVGNISQIFAFSIMPVVVVESICSSQPLFVLGLGIIFYLLFGDKFRENISAKHILRKGFFFILIIIGVFLVLK